MAAKAKNAASQPQPIYVVEGKNEYLVNNHCEQLIDKLLTDDQKAMGLIVADADKAEAADIFDELRTLPFLTDRRVVLIKDADSFISKYKELLEKYFESPSPTGSLILAVSTWRKNMRIAKQLDKVGTLISVSDIKRYKLADYVIGYVSDKYKVRLNKDAAELLVELVGDDAGRICSEADKLAVFAYDQKNITSEHVSGLIGHNRMFDAFGVIDAITDSGASVAVDRLRRMFEADKNAEYTVVGAFAYHFRRMFNLKAMLVKGNNPRQALTELGIRFGGDKLLAGVAKWSLEQLGSVMQSLAQIDYQAKTGQASASVQIEQLVLKACIIMNRRPARR